MKNITILDEHSRPFSRTYPRRADNLVKKGRASWVNETTIELSAIPSQETEDMNQMSDADILKIEAVPTQTTPWVEYFKSLAEKLADNESLVMHALDTIKQSLGCSGPDCPAEPIARILEAHFQFRTELFKSLMEFVDKRELK